MADNISIKDGNGNSVTVASTDNSGVQTPFHSLGDRADILVTGSITTANLNPSTGTPTAGSTLGPIALKGRGTFALHITAIGVGNSGNVQVSNDGVTWINVSNGLIVSTNQYGATMGSGVGLFIFNVSGAVFARLSMSGFTSGTLTATINCSHTQNMVSLHAPLPAGSQVGGAAAHDAAVSGNPVRIAGRALTANYATVSTGDTADLVTTLVGAVVNKPFSIPELDWSYAAATGGISNTTTAVTVKAAGAAGIRNYVTSMQVYAPTLGAATEIAVRDGAGGTVLWRGYAPTGGINQTIQFESPIKGTAATLLEVVTLTATVTGGVYFNLQGYTAP